MAGCLGIYLDDNIVKYAKLSIDNNKLVSVQKYGIFLVYSIRGIYTIENILLSLFNFLDLY